MISRADATELVLIAAAVGLVGVTATFYPQSIELGSLLALAALALLLQGLVRDLWFLARQRRGAVTESAEEVSCMCMESTLGLGVVLVGVILTAAGIAFRVPMAGWIWPIGAAAVWVGGFAVKDVVIQWSPWKLRRMKNHGSLIVRWRAASRK
jgi:hypothetical protein